MSLASYEEARPWAKAIKEEVLTRRMPRWHVVRGYGDFANDPSLSAFEIALIASWADGGAPKTLAGVNPHAAPASARAATPTNTRTVSVPCAARALPPGALVALKPVLAEGASVRISLLAPDGSEAPLIWLKDFEAKFAETYWLRSPVTVARGMRMLTDTKSCSVELTYVSRQRASATAGVGVRTDR